MNCREGDLAVVVGGERTRRNVGRVVRVIALAGPEDFDPLVPRDRCWRVDTPMRWDSLLFGSVMCPVAPDEYLRPIRDNDGEDETLAWAGKPQGVTA